MNSDAPAILDQLTKLGCRVTAQGDTLRVEATGPVPEDLLQAARAHKADLLELVGPGPIGEAPEDAYRRILRWLFALVAAGPDADPAACESTLQEELKLVDDLGPERAAQLRQAEARQWWALVKACPYCGERGTFHDGQADP